VATYAQFSALKPPLFHKAEEPLEADAWLRAIEAKFDVLTSPCSEERKVKFAAMYLRGPALLWWDHFKMMQPNGHEITWAEFKTAFKNHHIPKGMVERKLNELLNLRQGNFRSPNFQQQNARPNAPPPARTNNEGRCYNCGKPGHFMNACPQPRQRNLGRG
jgi:hypothetical protein